ncbi:PH domain [Popillia japonica]|uniref:PH domain n=1 Tax=Popillia japonica TaxID=7064 RepID=A0AAW1K151_POPJA
MSKSTSSHSYGLPDPIHNHHNHQNVVKCGYLKKVKTSKKKFFVLRSETPETSARLEYYDSERKFNAGQPPKRAITLKSCFNINRQPDAKHKHVIALFTKDDRFCIAFDSDEELDVWLKVLLSLQHGEEFGDGETPKPTFGEYKIQIFLFGCTYSRETNLRHNFEARTKD